MQQDILEEYLHPFWLGIFILLFVTVVIGIFCLIQKSFGPQIHHLYDRLCGSNDLKDDPNSKDLQRTSSLYDPKAYYVPPRDPSPKLYTLVRKLQLANREKDPSNECINYNECV